MEVELKNPRLREEKSGFSDPGANDACDAPCTHTQIYCRRARASTANPVPKTLTVSDRWRLGDVVSAINRLLVVRTARVRSC